MTDCRESRNEASLSQSTSSCTNLSAEELEKRIGGRAGLTTRLRGALCVVEASGELVMKVLRHLFAKLRLRDNESKSVVAFDDASR